MAMDLIGINNQNEYYTNHYFTSYFEENAAETISAWRAEAKESEEVKTPWSMLRTAARQYYPIHDRYQRSKFDTQTLGNIRTLADAYLKALGYPEAKPQLVELEDGTQVPVYLELQKSNGAPDLWVLLAASDDKDADILQRHVFNAEGFGEEGQYAVLPSAITELQNEKLADTILFRQAEPPRFILFIGINQIALIDRNKWDKKRYLDFNLGDIFSRNEETTLQAMAVLLHRDSLCPLDGTALLDELDANSQKHAQGVSQDLKFALRESIELLGNEVLYDMANRQGRDMQADPVDAGELTMECLRYMYRMLFVLFIESRSGLGYAPMQAQVYQSAYSLESLREIAENIREDVENVGEGFYLHETLSKLYDLIYRGYPLKESEFQAVSNDDGLHDIFYIAPLKAHIFDPEFTKMLGAAKIRNKVMLQIVDKMSMTRETGKKNSRRGRISYANLGINQMGSVYEALLSYRGFIAEEDLYEVKRKGDKINDLDVGYFVKERELDQYDEDERVRVDEKDPNSALRMYPKGTFVYRLAGREREKSASYYTPECLTQCLVKYALKELLKDKTADEILELTVCEPAMGSAAFLNEAINQLAEAYLDLKQKELGEAIPHDERSMELQKVKMYIADRNVYGIDLNPVAVELAEVSLWLNTIYDGAFVPWFGNQLVNGNSLIGARRQCYRTENLTATSKSLRWYENEPERVPLSAKRMLPKRVFHFLLGDPGMCSYTDKVIKTLEPENIKAMKEWNKRFTAPCTEDEVESMLSLSKTINSLWKLQVENRKLLEKYTCDPLSVYGHEEAATEQPSSIREKDKYLLGIYKSNQAQNAGPYARLKFAMDYWCALWFWPIDKAELLPSRSEYLNDMNMILVGVMQTSKPQNQMKLFSDMDEEEEILEETEVNLDQLCMLFPRLQLVRDIANQNKFMHWELEFADLFADRGGFDLMVGNPPWIKLTWNEKNVLSDENPMFMVKELSATQTKEQRNALLKSSKTRIKYFAEYISIAAQQSYLNAICNYAILKGQQTNLYKCFLPQAWLYCKESGISAFLHPESVYDDPNGGNLRKIIYSKLCYHFQFINEKMLFAEVGHPTIFGINVYSNSGREQFISISNLFAPATIDECFNNRETTKIEGIKDANGDWNLNGNVSRMLKIGSEDLRMISTVFDDVCDYHETRLPSLHATQLLQICKKIGKYKKLSDFREALSTSQMLNETGAQDDGTMIRETHFPENNYGMVYSGPHIWVANPVYKTPRSICKQKGDYDVIDPSIIPADYIPRSNYRIAVENEVLYNSLPVNQSGMPYIDSYRLAFRRRLNVKQERTLIGAIIAPHTLHTNLLNSLELKSNYELALISGYSASILYDFLIKSLGKGDLYDDSIQKLPFEKSKYDLEIIVRALRLNCQTEAYGKLWEDLFESEFRNITYSIRSTRIQSDTFKQLTDKWSKSIAIQSDFERYLNLLELDVLSCMVYGLTLNELKVLYKIQFPVLQAYSEDTWYDATGRIVFTNNRSLTGVGFTRPEFESANAVLPVQRGSAPWNGIMKDAPEGYVFERTITDDTMPGGPVERTIQYVAPFDRCDREQDYETAWKFFEEKYGGPHES